jgi:hypothetical protein
MIISGTVITTNNVPVNRTIRVYRRDTGALLASGNSNATTGIWSVDVPYIGEVQVVMLDNASGSVENDQILRAMIQ